MKLTKLALVGAVSFSAFAGGTQAFAEEAASMRSVTDVIFTENEGITGPVDPTNPDEVVEPIEDPENPDDTHEPGTNGPLSIDYVSNFHFGKQSISGHDKVYYAELENVKTEKGQEKKVPNYVQVTDNRGTNAGWKLTVKQDEQFATADGKKLDGAEIKLMNSVVNSATDKKYAPTAKPVTLNPDGSAQDVTSAQQGQGMGTWTTAYGQDIEQAKNSVSLSVPGTTEKVKDAKYKTTLTWTLEDTPK
ncbi:MULTISPECIES: WxL domain-containing protein [Bacillus cereus group]|uniref:WxL domain-containing protein n=1 Tax=Bacillus cereus VD196 TaxID=1053243 RepID=A0A9W5Q2R6_BACCE|nr:WxL domain-containing protein [Bacillus cereus]EOO65452.1 hypothetical protein IKE_03758 [Bacillus cereus VD196]MBM6769005.1 WxL domain-containing protein [Bacillus cereus]